MGKLRVWSSVPEIFMRMSNVLDLAIEEIAYLLPDELRERMEDLPFLQKWKGKIPEKTLQEGRPFNLKSAA